MFFPEAIVFCQFLLLSTTILNDIVNLRRYGTAKGNLIYACKVHTCNLDVTHGQIVTQLQVYEKYPYKILPVMGILVKSTRYVFV